MPVEVLCRLFEPAARWLARRTAKWIQPGENLPAALRPKNDEAVFNAMVNWHLARMLNFIPDRFSATKWQCRCEYRGLQAVQLHGEPVILATLHFGPLHLLRYWLRARGLAVTTLIEDSASDRSHLRQLKDWLSDSATGLNDIPQVISRQELFKVRQCLKPGRVLMISVDHTSGKQVTVATEDNQIELATGAIRLALSMKARLVPCLIAETGPWQYVIHFGQPVPPELLRPESGLEDAARHLWCEFLPLLIQHPEMMGEELKHCFKPAIMTATVTAQCLT